MRVGGAHEDAGRAGRRPAAKTGVGPRERGRRIKISTRHRSATVAVLAVAILSLAGACQRSRVGITEPSADAVVSPAGREDAQIPGPMMDEPKRSQSDVATDAPALELTAPLSPTVPARYDDRTSPADLLASLVNALNLGEHARASAYWESTPPPSHQDFVATYAVGATIQPALQPPVWIEGAAGSQYASIPALLVAELEDGTLHSFLGCYVARRTNPESVGDSSGSSWSLHSGTVLPTPGNSTDARHLGRACQGTAPVAPEPQYEDRVGPVGLLASYFNAIGRREYTRALSHWAGAARPSLSDLERRYEDTASIMLVAGPPSAPEGAVGNQYTTIGALVLATDASGGHQAYIGCYQMWRPSPNIEGSPVECVWSLVDAVESAAPGNSTDALLLRAACAEH